MNMLHRDEQMNMLHRDEQMNSTYLTDSWFMRIKDWYRALPSSSSYS